MTERVEAAIQAAMSACIAHAKRELCRDINDVAAAMGLQNMWVLYKWIDSGRMPAAVIPAFEAACGASHVSQCLADVAGFNTFVIELGHPSSPPGWAQVNMVVAHAMAQAAASAADPAQWRGAVRSINEALAALASLREQIAQGVCHGPA